MGHEFALENFVTRKKRFREIQKLKSLSINQLN